MSALMRTIDEINLENTNGELYEARMRNLFDNPYQDKVRLGLLRVVAEAGFTLRYLRSKKVIEVIAIRKLKRKGG
jgi:hypothetical protein